MHNITLINTRHQALGECNSNVLHQIIESINPEVIFEETSTEFSKSRNHFSLEGYTIGMYSVTHKIKRVPVDSVDMPSEIFFQKHENLLKRIEGLADINGSNYRNFTDKHKEYVELYGFKYLNSIDCINIKAEINNAIENGLQKINNDQLFKTHQLWKDINEKRENEMLQNIYKYSKENSYDRAIFTLGSGHRKSIIQKIEEYEKNETLKLNWIILN